MQQNQSVKGPVIRVLVAANSLVMRTGLETLIAVSSLLKVIGSSNFDTLAKQVEQLQPDVVLLAWDETEEPTFSFSSIDARGDGAIATNPAIVVLLEGWQQMEIADLLRSGVQAVLPTDATTSELIGAIQAAVIGLVVLHPEVADTLLPASVTARPLPATTNQALTPREVEVLQMLAEGVGNKEIASRLKISAHTVKFHIGSIFNKLNASSRTEAVILGARQGLILL